MLSSPTAHIKLFAFSNYSSLHHHLYSESFFTVQKTSSTAALTLLMYSLFASTVVISISKSLLFTANNYKISRMTLFPGQLAPKADSSHSHSVYRNQHFNINLKNPWFIEGDRRCPIKTIGCNGQPVPVGIQRLDTVSTVQVHSGSSAPCLNLSCQSLI